MTSQKTKKTSTKAASPARVEGKTSAKATVKKPVEKKAVAKKSAPKSAAAQTSQEMMLARVESVRLSQRNEGYFDCFGRAENGFCDQGGCVYHAECLSVSQLLHSL
jgi:hypothetical protein